MLIYNFLFYSYLLEKNSDQLIKAAKQGDLKMVRKNGNTKLDYFFLRKENMLLDMKYNLTFL